MAREGSFRAGGRVDDAAGDGPSSENLRSWLVRLLSYRSMNPSEPLYLLRGEASYDRDHRPAVGSLLL